MNLIKVFLYEGGVNIDIVYNLKLLRDHLPCRCLSKLDGSLVGFDSSMLHLCGIKSTHLPNMYMNYGSI